VDNISNCFCYIFWYSSRPLGLIKLEPQDWCFALKSPPTRNLCPSEIKFLFNYVAGVGVGAAVYG
jgi:hypothetical protein